MKTTIKTLLIAIKEKPNTSAGICGQPAMMSLRLGAFTLVRELMVQWPKYSGSYSYPVPSTMEGYNARECFHNNLHNAHECFHNNLHNLWDASTEYGALRRELLDWLIEQPETDVELYRMQRVGDGARDIFNIKD